MLSTSRQLVQCLLVLSMGMVEVALGMLLIIYTSRGYAAPQAPLWIAVAIVAVMLLVAFAVAVLFPSKRAKEEELAREELIKAQSRQRRADRR